MHENANARSTWQSGQEDFIRGGNVDFVGARRIVNGLDRAEDVAAYARSYASLLA